MQWLKDNWKTIAVILLIAFAVACMFIPALAPLGAAILFGMLLGGASRGINGLVTGWAEGKRGGELFDCFTHGLADGMLLGGIMGAMGHGLGALGAALGLGGRFSALGGFLTNAGKVLNCADYTLDTVDLAAMGLDLKFGDNAFSESVKGLHSDSTYNYLRLGITLSSVAVGAGAEVLNCFVAGTLVLTAAGIVAIEKIKARDLVMSADGNGNRGMKRVVRAFARQTDSIVTIHAGGTVIRCTPEHPFFVEEKGFVYASDLEPGNILAKSDGGDVMVSSVEADETVNAENTVTVYNFEVEDWHTYFVGEDGVLVHNKCGPLSIDTKNLEVVGERPAENSNIRFRAKKYADPYDVNYEVKIVKAGDEEFVRVFSYKPDGRTNMRGTWVMRKSDVEGLSPAQIKDLYALPKEPTHICDVKLPGDFLLQTGICNGIEGFGKGGGQQFNPIGDRIPNHLFVNERLIGE